MMSNEQIEQKLRYFIGESNKLSDVFYSGIQDAVKLRSLYACYKEAFSRGEEVRHSDITIKIASLEGTIDLARMVLFSLKRGHQELNNSD